MSKLSRRQFLAAVPVVAALGSCRGRPYDDANFRVPARSAVGLFDAPHYGVDFSEIIFRALGELGFDVAPIFTK